MVGSAVGTPGGPASTSAACRPVGTHEQRAHAVPVGAGVVGVYPGRHVQATWGEQVVRGYAAQVHVAHAVPVAVTVG